jgi:hypothetical protein
MKKQLFTLVLLLLAATSGFAQFTLNITAPAATDACYVGGNFNGWSYTQLSYVSTSSDETTKLFSSSTLPASFAGGSAFYVYNAPINWAYTLTPESFISAATGSTSQDVTVTSWRSAVYYTFINVTVPYAVSECYFLSDQTGWTLPTNATKMTLSATNTDTKVYSYALQSWSNSTHAFSGLFYAGLDGANTTYGQKTPATNFTNPGTGNTLDFTVTEFKAIYAPVATALQNAENESNLIKVIDNKIIAEGIVSNVSIFDVRGSLIQSVNTKGIFNSKTLNPGLYIIRVDNKSYKQVVN